MDTSLNWDDLRYFSMVASTLSIREAAVQSNISAATLSRRIVNLEEKVGEALFIRRANRLTLTPLGKDILSQVDQVRMQVSSIEERCAIRPGRRKIRINMPSSYARMFLYPLLREMSARLGDMTIIIENEQTEAAHSDIVVSCSVPQDDQFSHRELAAIDLRLYRGRGTAASPGLVLWPSHCEEFRFLNEQLRRFQPTASDRVIVDSADAYVSAVAEGFGIGLICERTVASHPRGDELEPLEQRIRRTLWLSTRTNAVPSAVIRQLEQRIYESQLRPTQG